MHDMLYSLISGEIGGIDVVSLFAKPRSPNVVLVPFRVFVKYSLRIGCTGQSLRELQGIEIRIMRLCELLRSALPNDRSQVDTDRMLVRDPIPAAGPLKKRRS
jgi:hypothetical protein